jgi:hypothetical protein
MRPESLTAAHAQPHGGDYPAADPPGLWRASRRVLWLAGLTGLFSLGICAILPAQGVTQITRVEEDWELVVDVPDADAVAPQVTTVIATDPNLEDAYGIFEFNHATQPEYSSGGLQVQAWNGEDLAGTKRQHAGSVLRNANETVTWTASMSLENNWLRFQISNGTSTSWGVFGNSTVLRKGTWYWNSNLNSYSPEVSVENSRVGFASNRVKKLTLKSVRYYSGTTLVSTDSTVRVVFEPNDLVESLE